MNILSVRAGFFIAFSLFCFACKNNAGKQVEAIAPTKDTLRTRVLSQQEQAALSPQQVFQVLLDGNARFLNNNLTTRDHSAMVRNARNGQHPMAFVLSCIDSRVPVEDVFDLGIGDLFVGRVAGNIVNADMLGSMEYACKVSGAKLILVMGHRHCGAIKSAIDGVQLGNITALLKNIQPAVKASADFKGEKTSSNYDYVLAVSIKNVLLTVAEIRKRSAILKAMEEKGEITILPVGYDIEDGKISPLAVSQ
jgi:carbonic anhydrase